MPNRPHNPAKPRLFYGWYIVAASVATNFYITLAFGLGFNVFFLPIVRDFGWTRALTSGAFALRSVENGLMAPIIGFLVDRWGSRLVILIGLVLIGLGMVMIGSINSLGTFYVAFLIAGLGASAAGHGVSWVVVVANWFDKSRGKALGLAVLGPVIGGPCLFLVALLEEMVGWRHATIILGIGVWILGIPLALIVRDEPRQYGYLPDGDHDKTIQGQAQAQSSPTDIIDSTKNGLSVPEALLTRDFWVITTLFALMFVGISGLMVHLIPLVEDLNYTSTQGASLLGLMFFLSGIGRISAGFLADRFDYRAVLLGLTGCQIAGLLVLATADRPHLWLLAIFTLVFGIGFGGTIPLRPFLIMRIFGSRSFGALQGLLQMGATGAGVIGPVFYGWIFDTTGSYDIALYATVSTVIMTLPLTMSLRNPTTIPRYDDTH